jgi:hypothetical protein
MPGSITNDFSAFKEALLSDSTFVCSDGSGNWSTLRPCKKSFTSLRCFEEQRWGKLAASLVREFDRLEKTPVSFGKNDEQTALFAEHLEAAKFVQKRMKDFLGTHKVKKQFDALRQRMAAMRYRIEAENGGQDRQEPKEAVTEELEELAKKWKLTYPLYQDKEICQSERDKLREAAAYPKFAKLLVFDSAMRNLFFRWALRDNNSVDAFVQFPSTCNRLKSALITGRIGRFAEHFQLVQKVDNEKVFTLPFQVEEESGELRTRQISILDESQTLTLRGKFQLTIQKAIRVFANKNLDTGCLEFMGTNGICNWHPHELGWWNQQESRYEVIDLEEENSEWWKQLPVFETLDSEQVKTRYGIEELQDGQWVAVAKSSRESLSLDIDRSHGYFEVLIPDATGSRYNVYPMGKFAKNFPTNLLAKCLFVTNTVESRIEYPDENPFYSHRQQASASFPLEEGQALELMETLRKDLLSARQGNVVFQFSWENCAWWPQERLEGLLGKSSESDGKVPNLFVAKILDARPKLQPLKGIFGFCRNLPERIKNVAARAFAFLLGSWRGIYVIEGGRKIFKSTKTSDFRKNCEMYHPALMHVKIQNDEINGKVLFGHHHLPQTARTG